MSTDCVAALVKCGHGLVGRSNLDLHKVRLRVIAGWTNRVCGIDVLPGCSSAHNVINLLEMGNRGLKGFSDNFSIYSACLQLGIDPGCDLLGDVANVGTCTAGKAIVDSGFFDDQNVTASWAKRQHNCGSTLVLIDEIGTTGCLLGDNDD